MKISEIITEYINTNEKIENNNKKLKGLRDYNKKLTDGIIHFMENNKKSDITYKNSTFELKKNKSSSVISQKLLKDSLMSYFNNDDEKVKNVLNHILNNRTQTEKTELKFKQSN